MRRSVGSLAVVALLGLLPGAVRGGSLPAASPTPKAGAADAGIPADLAPDEVYAGSRGVVFICGHQMSPPWILTVTPDTLFLNGCACMPARIPRQPRRLSFVRERPWLVEQAAAVRRAHRAYYAMPNPDMGVRAALESLANETGIVARVDSLGKGRVRVAFTHGEVLPVLNILPIWCEAFPDTIDQIRVLAGSFKSHMSRSAAAGVAFGGQSSLWWPGLDGSRFDATLKRAREAIAANPRLDAAALRNLLGASSLPWDDTSFLNELIYAELAR